MTGSALGPVESITPRIKSEKIAFLHNQCLILHSSSLSLSAFPQLIPFDLPAVKEEPPQERPTANQTLTEVITEQANLSISAARSSKVLYVITTSPSHPPQTVPGSSSQTPSKRVGATQLEGNTLYRALLGVSHSKACWGSGSVILFALAFEKHFPISLIP